jgi:hypothetical protein
MDALSTERFSHDKRLKASTWMNEERGARYDIGVKDKAQAKD